MISLKQSITTLLNRKFGTALKFKAYGDPRTVLQSEEFKLEPVKPNEILVKVLASPVNPADVNFIQGVYGVKASFPSGAGSECVAVVKEVGKNVNSSKTGDWVIPVASTSGVWRTEIVGDEKEWLQIPNDIPSHYAATISVNPCTAYRLLHDFVDLKPGDFIVQNGANSMVGMAVIQIAREMGIKTINIIRSDRPNATRILRLLSNLGGDINIPDNYLNTPGFQEILKEVPDIKLALNATGGDVVTDIARILANNGTIVTYGGMSKKKISIPPELLAYKQLNLKGYWMLEWNRSHSVAERKDMIEKLCDLIRSNKLAFFFEAHDFDDYQYAIEKSQEPFSLRKVLLNMDYPDRLKEHDANFSQEEIARIFDEGSAY